MIYFSLIVIILLLVYIAFFTPEKRGQREIRNIRKAFDTPLPAFRVEDLRRFNTDKDPEEVERN